MKSGCLYMLEACELADALSFNCLGAHVLRLVVAVRFHTAQVRAIVIARRISRSFESCFGSRAFSSTLAHCGCALVAPRVA